MGVWLAAAVLVGTAQICTRISGLGAVEGAALVTAVSAAGGLPLPHQFAVFAVATVVLVGMELARRIVLRRRHQSRHRRFGLDTMVGTQPHVVPEITDRNDRARIDGEEWTVPAIDDSPAIPVDRATYRASLANAAGELPHRALRR
jgi:membrane protein implicated in regulation of membrane protease activity